mmetsp:Transcript_30528/g.59901  ORF Transcript_30528/g.59901 Transcript_30528/m.59901 type:complete len:99 (-) Transcript_30528:134-430(-)
MTQLAGSRAYCFGGSTRSRASHAESNTALYVTQLLSLISNMLLLVLAATATCNLVEWSYKERAVICQFWQVASLNITNFKDICRSGCIWSHQQVYTQS